MLKLARTHLYDGFTFKFIILIDEELLSTSKIEPFLKLQNLR